MSDGSTQSVSTVTTGVSEPERRTAVRKSIRGAVTLVFNGQHRVEVRADDISVTGLGVIIDRDLKPQVTCEIQLQLPGRGNLFKQYQVMGKTVSSTLSTSRGGFRIGLVFVQPTSEFRQAVDAYIKR